MVNRSTIFYLMILQTILPTNSPYFVANSWTRVNNVVFSVCAACWSVAGTESQGCPCFWKFYTSTSIAEVPPTCRSSYFPYNYTYFLIVRWLRKISYVSVSCILLHLGWILSSVRRRGPRPRADIYGESWTALSGPRIVVSRKKWRPSWERDVYTQWNSLAVSCRFRHVHSLIMTTSTRSSSTVIFYCVGIYSIRTCSHSLKSMRHQNSRCWPPPLLNRDRICAAASASTLLEWLSICRGPGPDPLRPLD